MDERLVMSLKVLPNQPYGSDVHEMYLSFVCGELEVWDLEQERYSIRKLYG